jgi:hypothetical protein
MRGNSTLRYPDVFVVNMGLHSCYHAYEHGGEFKMDYIRSQTNSIDLFMKTMHTAFRRLRKPRGSRAHVAGQDNWNQGVEEDASDLTARNGTRREGVPTRQKVGKTLHANHLHYAIPTVVVMTAGRAFYRHGQMARREIDLCIVHMNRAVTRYAHKYGFHVRK